MKKAKEVLRNIVIFVVMMGVSILPTVMFRTRDEMNFLFRQPEYWVISAFIAAVATWRLAQALDNFKK